MGECNHSITIHCNLKKAWSVIKKFDDLSWATSIVESVDSSKKNQRVINGVFHETLINLDNNLHQLSYKIDQGPGPLARDNIASYVGTISVTEMPNGVIVNWCSVFSSNNDNSVIEFCNPIYQTLLSDLKNHLEG